MSADNVTPCAAKLAARREWRAITLLAADGKTAWVIDSRKEALKFVRTRLDHDGFEGVLQHGLVESDYSLVFAEVGAVLVGDDLQSWSRVQKALDAAGIDVPYHTPKAWDPVRRCLVRLAEVEPGDERAEAALEWLHRYVGEQMLGSGGKDADTVSRRAPFRDSDGRLHVSLTDLTTFVNRSIGERVTWVDVRRLLRRNGFERAGSDGQVSVRDGDRVVKARYWRSPPGFDPANA